MRRKLVIGLIGSIGSGKSLIAGLLARRGARVIAGDKLGHEALERTDIRKEILKRWGTRLAAEGNAIKRRELAAIVFADPAERKVLESMVFPWIEARIQEELEKAQADPEVPLIVLDAAVMLEAGWDRWCDRLLFIDAPRQVRRDRLASRGWTEKELEAREAAQWPLSRKAARADACLDNSGSIEETECRLNAILRSWNAWP